MKRALIKLAIFGMPFAVVPGLPVGVAVYSGEFIPLAAVARRQLQGSPLLYGRAYRDNYFAFKLISARWRRPDVLVFGSSRVMQFRSMFLNRSPERFFNAGGAAQSTIEAQLFLREFYSVPPQVLILGLDQGWLLACGETAGARVREQLDDESRPTLERALRVNRSVMEDLWRGKISLPRVLARRDPTYGVSALGLNAIMNGSGFRNDGSYQYRHVKRPPPVEERLVEGFTRLRDNVTPMQAADRIARPCLVEVDKLLGELRIRGTYVIGLSPPFAPALYRAMRRDGKHEYLADLAKRVGPLFEAHGFAYFDFSDPSWLGATDQDMLDFSHPSEYLCLLMYYEMLRLEPAGLARYSDGDFLEGLKRNASSNRFELIANRFR